MKKNNTSNLSGFSEMIIAFFEENKVTTDFGINQHYINSKIERLDGLTNFEAMKWALSCLDSENKAKFALKLGNPDFFEALKIVFETLERVHYEKSSL